MIVNPTRLCYTLNEKAPVRTGLNPDQVKAHPARFYMVLIVTYLRCPVKGSVFV